MSSKTQHGRGSTKRGARVGGVSAFQGAFFKWLRDTAWPWLYDTAGTLWNWTFDIIGDFFTWLKDVAWPWR